jgi:hypothetical protein
MKVDKNILMASHGNDSDTWTSWTTSSPVKLERADRRPFRLSTFIKAKDDALQMETYIKYENERRTATQVTRRDKAEEEKKRIEDGGKKYMGKLAGQRVVRMRLQ